MTFAGMDDQHADVSRCREDGAAWFNSALQPGDVVAERGPKSAWL